MVDPIARMAMHLTNEREAELSKRAHDGRVGFEIRLERPPSGLGGRAERHECHGAISDLCATEVHHALMLFLAAIAPEEALDLGGEGFWNVEFRTRNLAIEGDRA